jgi:ferredoxin-NADP reductase
LGDGSDLKTYEIAVKRLESGRGGSKELIDQYQIGDCIEVQEPRNLFPLVRAPRYLFIAGGIGITPMIAFMKSLLKQGNSDFHLIYCSRFEGNSFQRLARATYPTKFSKVSL